MPSALCRRLLLLLLGFSWAPATPVLAQAFFGELKLGLTAATFQGETDAEEIDPRVGWGGGVAVGFDFGNGLQLATEALYVGKGAYATTDADGVPVRAQFAYTYLELPVLLAYRFAPGRRIYPKLMAGPFAAFRLGATLTTRAVGSELELSEDDVLARGTDYGLTFGGGAEVDFDGQRIMVGARAAFSLAEAREQASVRNTSVVLTVGLLF